MIKTEEIIKVGKFQKTHALKGELNLILDLDPSYFSDGNPLIVDYDGIMVPHYIETIRPKGSTSFLVKLEDINSAQEAMEFVNKDIYILKKDAEQLMEEDLLMEHPFVGYFIVDWKTGKELGEIIDIEDSTTNVLFIIENGGQEIYVPAVNELIKEIDEENKIIKMEIPEGLLEINSSNKGDVF